MNLKRISLILVVFFVLILSAGAISAADDVNVTDVDNTPNETLSNDVGKAAPVEKIQTDVDADGIVAEKGKNSFFKVEVENEKTDKPIKNLKLNLKIFTKSKSKIYVVTTAKNGIAKFNTKKLSAGTHKVIITSADDKYKVYKKSSIVIGKKHTVTMKLNTVKKLKNKDKIKLYKKYDDDEIEIKMKVIKGGSIVKTHISKAKFYFKNKRTGKIIVKTDHGEFDDGKWQNPDEDYSPSIYTPVKVKIYYVS